MVEAGKKKFKQIHRAPSGHYSDKPTSAFLGKHPGRAPLTRGRVWGNAESLAATEDDGLFGDLASLSPPPGGGVAHSVAVAAAPGTSYPWEGASGTSDGSLNTGNGNKLTSIHLFSWQARGGKSMDFTLYHNSETNYSDELGAGWTWSYDLYINNLTGNPVVHYGNGLSVPYTASGSTFTAPPGVYEKLVQNLDDTWKVTAKDQTGYNFNTSGYCTSIVDRNGNAITLTLNSSFYVTKVTDPTGRHYTISLSSGNKFQSVTDPLGRTWSFTLNGSSDLSTVTWPSLGDGHTYTDAFTYSSHDITVHADRLGNA